MIVQCDQCQTRFKIPDEKVTSKGVKVRCTKCQHTFRVQRPEAGASSGTPAPSADPFALFDVLQGAGGSAGERPGTRPTPPPVTLGGAAAPGAAVPLPGVGTHPRATPPPVAGLRPTPAPVRGTPVPGVAGARPTPAPVGRPGTRPTPAPVRPTPPPVSAGAARGFELLPPAPPSRGTPPPAAGLGVDLASLPPVRPAGTPVSSGAPSTDRFGVAPATDRFGGAAPTDTGRFGVAPAASSAPTDTGRFGLPAPGAAPVESGRSGAAPAAQEDSGRFGRPSPPDPDAGIERFGDSRFGAPAASPADPFGAAPPGGLLGDLQPSDATQPFQLAADPTAARRSLFDMPARAAAAATPASSPGAAAAPAATPAPVPNIPTPPPGSILRPVGRPQDVGIPEGPGLVRRITTAGLNLAAGVVLVAGVALVGNVYLNEGRLDVGTLAPRRLLERLSPPRALRALDVSNGLYDTASGRPVFFVRGVVENRTDAAAPVRVRAALWDGEQLVRSAEVAAGRLPSPEELHAAGTPEAAAALGKRLDADAAPVGPGARAPFLVVFPESPVDLAAYRLEVTLAPVGTEPAAARR